MNAAASKGTFRSSINLSQGASATVKSTYSDTHGASMPQLMAAVQNVAQQHAEVSIMPVWQCWHICFCSSMTCESRLTVMLECHPDQN